MRNHLLKNKSWYLLMVMSCLSLLAFFINSESFIVINLIIWFSFGIFSAFNNGFKVIRFLFLCSFFNFLIGRLLLILLDISHEFYFFKDVWDVAGTRLILFSLMILVITFCILDTFKPIVNNCREYIACNYKFLFYVFLLIFLIATFNAADRMYFVISKGYLAIYRGEFIPKLPFLVSKLGDFLIPLFVTLSLFNLTKKQRITINVLLIINLAIVCFGGNRFDFIIGLFIMAIMYVVDSFINKRKIFEFKKMMRLFIVTIIMFALLSVYQIARDNYKFEQINPFYYVEQFIYNQGVSANINKRIYKYQSDLVDCHQYSYQKIINLFSRYSNRLLGEKILDNNNLNKVASCDLAARLSYLVLGDRYLDGEGVGSSYIAEVYLDFGYIGLLIYNLGLGLLLYTIEKWLVSKTFYRLIIALYIYQGILMLPRSSASLFIIRFFDVVIWLFIVSLFLWDKILSQRSKYA